MLKLQVKMLATLWENTYRATVTDEQEQYVATVRLVVNIPIDPDLLPENAPTVEPQLFILVEDAAIESKDIIDFETLLTAVLMDKFKYEIQHMFYFYPSPEDMLTKGHIDVAAE